MPETANILMTIEEEIQSHFQNEQHKALVNLIFTHNYIVNELNKRFKRHDITMQQFNVLRILRGQFPNPSTVGLIKERMLDKMSDASRILDRLNKKGLIEKGISLYDRRNARVLITPKGRDLLENIDRETKSDPYILEHLSNDEAEVLNRILDECRTQIDKRNKSIK